MASKEIRRWVKQEKRTVKLLYKKGFLKDFKIEELYWAEYNWLGRKVRKTKYGNYRYPIYMPEVHYCTTDYWGESDEHSVVDHVKQHLYWSHLEPYDYDEMEEGQYPKSLFHRFNRDQFIKWLEKQPTVVSDNKIRKVLKKRVDE